MDCTSIALRLTYKIVLNFIHQKPISYDVFKDAIFNSILCFAVCHVCIIDHILIWHFFWRLLVLMLKELQLIFSIFGFDLKCLDACHYVVFLVQLSSLCLFQQLHQYYETPILKILGVLVIPTALFNCKLLCWSCVHVFAIVCSGMLALKRVTKSSN